jgi:hypothetical protein
MAKAAASVQSTRDALVAQASAWGLLPEQVEKVLDRYGLVPSEIATLISQPGMDKAQLELLLLKAKAEDVPGSRSITVSTLSDEAVAKLEAVGFKVRDVPGGKEIVLQGNDVDFNAKLNQALQPATKTVYLQYRDPGAPGAPRLGAPNLANYDGNIVMAQAYAVGGVHRLTPMRGGLAAKVPPNTWRIIGDRWRGNEYYLPDDDAPRSLALGMEWAKNRGLTLVKAFAAGGITSTSAAPVSPSAGFGGTTINNTYVVRDDRTAYEVGKVTTAEQAWQMRSRPRG